MKTFAIFGNPVAHSKSPQMHNAGFKHINFNANYIKHQLEDAKNIKEVFLANNYLGANITVPHKEIAFAQADEICIMAKEIKAVNTYILKDNKVLAYNTDAPGFLKAIESFGKINSVLVLGTGGTAKAIAIALKSQKISVSILNRSSKNFDFFKTQNIPCFTWDDFSCEKYDLIVNATSAGLKDEFLPAPKEILEQIFSKASFAFDCIYGKTTPFLALGKDKGLKTKDGEDMLLYQGVLAFELFTNTKADDGLVKAMKTGLMEV